jgi:hypothetical protein
MTIANDSLDNRRDTEGLEDLLVVWLHLSRGCRLLASSPLSGFNALLASLSGQAPL